MTAVRNDAQTKLYNEPQEQLMKGGLVGLALGSIFGRPIAGGIVGALYKLLSTEGMADGMSKAVGSFLEAKGGTDGIMAQVKETLGDNLAGAVKDGKVDTAAIRDLAVKAGGVPTWMKFAGVGLGALLFRGFMRNVRPMFSGRPPAFMNNGVLGNAGHMDHGNYFGAGFPGGDPITQMILQQQQGVGGNVNPLAAFMNGGGMAI